MNANSTASSVYRKAANVRKNGGSNSTLLLIFYCQSASARVFFLFHYPFRKKNMKIAALPDAKNFMTSYPLSKILSARLLNINFFYPHPRNRNKIYINIIFLNGVRIGRFALGKNLCT